MAFLNTEPVASDKLSVSQPKLLANMVALETAIDADHDFTTAGTQTGTHDQVTFTGPQADVTVGTNQGGLFTKDVSAKAELHWKDESANTKQLTSAGIINVAIADCAGVKKDEDDMASDSATHFPTQQSVKAFVTTGTVTMSNKTLTSPVLNTGVSGTAFLDEDNMASNSATQLASQQSIKAYTDNTLNAKVGAGTMDPLAYAAEESVTLPNGFILKGGYLARTANSTTLTFDTAFPNAILSLTATVYNTSPSGESHPVQISALATTGATIFGNESGYEGYYWMAMGY